MEPQVRLRFHQVHLLARITLKRNTHGDTLALYTARYLIFLVKELMLISKNSIAAY